MIRQANAQPCIISLVPTKTVSSSANIVLLQSNSNAISNGIQSNVPEVNTVSTGQHVVNNIYVCTFCQVFSPILSTVCNHISIAHSHSLPAGTKPEDFVSKLQKLDGIENIQKKQNRKGRPKKVQVENTVQDKSKQKNFNPVPDSNGLFWCKTCLRYFRKSRQLIQHICFDPESEVSSEESSVELNEDVDFKTYMNIDPSPWSRFRKNKETKIRNFKTANEVSSELNSLKGDKIVEYKVLPNWRTDPAYIPLFDNEKEKIEFEEHLKSIDYSFVDNMYKIVKRNKNQSGSSVIFSCYFCKKECKSLSHIRAHCLIHTDSKPFTCLKCSYRTNSSGSLYLHMRKHTGNVFWCSICDFKCMKRSHLLDHEATHTAEYQTCKLCKNSYKTLKSLVNHVRKYHDYPNGKKYMKQLTCKQSKFVCHTCNKKFKTLNILNNHNHACHENTSPPDTTSFEENISEQSLENVSLEITDPQLQINETSTVESPINDLQCNGLQVKDPLAEIVLSDFLQQPPQSENMYRDVFNHSDGNILFSSNNDLLLNRQAKVIVERLPTETILQECQKSLDLDIIEECLQSSGFSNEYEEFDLIPNITRNNSLQTNSESNSEIANHLNEISHDKLEELKSAEIKLFEKCCQKQSQGSQQQQSQSIMYQNVSNQPDGNPISSCNNDLLLNLQAKVIVERLATETILQECQKSLDLDIIKECFQNNGFSNQCDKFNLVPNISKKHSLQTNSGSNSDVTSHTKEISGDKLEEPKSVEIKLFENYQHQQSQNSQQQRSESIMYQNVFNQPSENIIFSSENDLLLNRQAKVIVERLPTETILQECQKSLDLDIIEECLQNSRFSNQCEDFNLISNISRKHSLQTNSENDTKVASHLNEISCDQLEQPKSIEIKLFEKCQQQQSQSSQQQQSQSIIYQNVFNQLGESISSSNNDLLLNLQAKVIVERLAAETILQECQKEEPKSVETKLFEKCQRAPAYVCYVCSSIFICASTLKAHLREHVNSTISSFMNQAQEQQFENATPKAAETAKELDVCEILQDSSESFSFDKELEKLYTSSLDLMYYLPEVSVVLENDAVLFDTVLDDISNFPINDDSSQDLNENVEEENVLKMFS